MDGILRVGFIQRDLTPDLSICLDGILRVGFIQRDLTPDLSIYLDGILRVGFIRGISPPIWVVAFGCVRHAVLPTLTAD